MTGCSGAWAAARGTAEIWRAPWSEVVPQLEASRGLPPAAVYVDPSGALLMASLRTSDDRFRVLGAFRRLKPILDAAAAARIPAHVSLIFPMLRRLASCRRVCVRETELGSLSPAACHSSGGPACGLHHAQHCGVRASAAADGIWHLATHDCSDLHAHSM